VQSPAVTTPNNEKSPQHDSNVQTGSIELAGIMSDAGRNSFDFPYKGLIP
jgi:hypothetical protein